MNMQTIKLIVLLGLAGVMLTVSFGCNESAVVEEEEAAVEILDEDPVSGEATNYYIDYENGTIPIGELPIGARVVDPSWEWEYRLGYNYSDVFWADGYWDEDISPGEVKPVTWIVVAKDHYEGLEPHVTLLSEDLIGRFTFDNSTDRDHVPAESSYNHWGESGTGNATLGLRPWLNSTGIHAGEGFYRAFSESFKRAVLTTTVPNREWEDGSAYSTSDHVFIPSTTELNDEDHDETYPIGKVYAYFAEAGDEERVAHMVGDGLYDIVARKYAEEVIEAWGLYGNNWHYLTRSPSAVFGFLLRGVISNGAFGNVSSCGDRDYDGVRPALNLKSEILVSEINP